MIEEKFENNELVEFTTQIVSAYVSITFSSGW